MPSLGRYIPSSLVSPRIRSAARQRLAELGGMTLWLLALALAASLWSYNPRDPSMNTASTQAPTNLLGVVGAYLADALLQNIGITCALPVLALVAWGWRVARHTGLGSVPVRVVALLCAMPVIGALLGAVPLLVPALPAPHWPTESGPGGAFGLSIARTALQAGSSVLGPAGRLAVWCLGLLLTALLVPLAMGLSLAEWAAIGRTLRAAARQPARLARGMPGRHSPPDQPPAAPAGRWAGGLGRAPDGILDGALEGAMPPPRPDLSMQPRAPEPQIRSLRIERPDAARAPARPSTRPSTRPSLGTGWVQPPGVEDDAAADPPPLLLGGPRQPDGPAWSTEEAAFAQAAAETAPAEPPREAAAEPPRTGFMGRLFGSRAAADRPSADLRGAAGRTAGGNGGYPPPPDAGAPWQLPSVRLLKAAPPHGQTGPSQDMLQANARLLETVLSDYGVQGRIGEIHAGPVVTLYELEPAPGIRSARVIGLADDVARSLSVLSVRIATVPGRNVIGIEVPNARRETVYLSELFHDAAWTQSMSRLSLALGKDISGAPVYGDLARMPHLLIAGTTGSGKSVGVNAMILSLLYRLSPDECRLILIDPKILELSIYEGIPHLMTPVVTEPAKAVAALKWTVREMDRRYRAMSHLQVRNIGSYNERVAEARMRGEVVSRRVQTGYDPETGRPTFEEQQLALDSLPYIVVVIDEMADLMMVAGKEIEAAVQRLAQKARAAGIHVIMATQRPSVDVITGTIKANFPTRISFQVISKFDSRTILGEQGAEQLLGQGDMLYMQGGGRITRVHGPFVADSEVEDVVAFLRSQGEPIYNDDVISAQDEDGGGGGGGGKSSGNGLNGGGFDEETSLFDQAVAVVAREGKASTSFIQRHLSIGYNRAAKIIEQMEKEGIVSPANHVGKREVLLRRTDDDE
ncbi:DNA translocase FtsK 4TM domain-containing protein [Nguyenibacter sp. L1]|uniref:FtsK/SpoIIIE family DNA translocase n=1 Tax=Nguyenibacter sp. L1 TaxID=3049350 RepID=UPI002B492E4E|nr:DNA translocase FtsK 4TM domain-containing protein [Nguyenibacter sp. L1]WRH86502.1 DNA translocase FtsK 4TM domain-containing protein [Nguyenibacter sp. L1]